MTKNKNSIVLCIDSWLKFANYSRISITSVMKQYGVNIEFADPPSGYMPLQQVCNWREVNFSHSMF
eukprot:2427140-Amphidinium_carterae.2